MNNEKKIFIAGHTGMVGSSILKKFQLIGYHNIITRSSAELDLRNQKKVINFFEAEKPDVVILSAAKVGGINANIKYPVAFLYDNLMIQSNVLYASAMHKVEKFV